MVKRTGPTNPLLQELIKQLKEQAAKENAKIWKRIAKELEKPRRNKRVVNIYKINKYAKENETVIVPGKVLSVGELSKNITVAAYQFSNKAFEKINKKGKAITITELMKINPKGSNVRIIC